MCKILITGSSGYIGRNLVEYLSPDYTILSPTSKQLNLLNEDEVELYFITHHPDMVIHCANKYGDVSLKENMQMFLNILKYHQLYCKGKMLYFGSGAEYARQNWKCRLLESNVGDVIPTDEYGLSKFVMNTFTRAENRVYNLRLFAVFGKYEKMSVRFISNCCGKILRDEPIVIRKNLLFDYMYVKDLCRVVKWFIEHTPKFKDYNICTSTPHYLKDIALKLMQISGKSVKIKEQDEVFCYNEYSGDNTRLLNEINFSFTPFETALTELYDYYRTKPTI